MKKALYLVFAMLTTSFLVWADADDAIGKERIKPHDYPKFAFSVEFDVLRKVKILGENGSTRDLRDQHGYTLAFEASLYKYLNAGAAFTVNIPSIITDPVNLRLGLFAKPFIPLHERVDVFARVGGGLGGMMAGILVGAAGHAMGSLGIEYFPLSRLGLAVEYGLRAELIRARPLGNNSDGKATMMMFYETPIALSLLMIL